MAFLKHGMARTRLYRAWTNMRNRCNWEKDREYQHYGGRGIKVCDEWQNSFEPFMEWALSHGYNDTLTIDRINVDGNYEPDNCRWITRKEQNNNMTSNVRLTHNGITHNLTEGNREYGWLYSRILHSVRNFMRYRHRLHCWTNNEIGGHDGVLCVFNLSRNVVIGIIYWSGGVYRWSF